MRQLWYAHLEHDWYCCVHQVLFWEYNSWGVETLPIYMHVYPKPKWQQSSPLHFGSSGLELSAGHSEANKPHEFYLQLLVMSHRFRSDLDAAVWTRLRQRLHHRCLWRMPSMRFQHLANERAESGCPLMWEEKGRDSLLRIVSTFLSNHISRWSNLAPKTSKLLLVPNSPKPSQSNKCSKSTHWQLWSKLSKS